MIAAFFPLPPNPLFKVNQHSDSELDVESDLARHYRPMDEARYENAKWWRRLNRGMSVVGLLILGAIVCFSFLINYPLEDAFTDLCTGGSCSYWGEGRMDFLRRPIVRVFVVFFGSGFACTSLASFIGLWALYDLVYLVYMVWIYSLRLHCRIGGELAFYGIPLSIAWFVTAFTCNHRR